MLLSLLLSIRANFLEVQDSQSSHRKVHSWFCWILMRWVNRLQMTSQYHWLHIPSVDYTSSDIQTCTQKQVRQNLSAQARQPQFIKLLYRLLLLGYMAKHRTQWSSSRLSLLEQLLLHTLQPHRFCIMHPHRNILYLPTYWPLSWLPSEAFAFICCFIFVENSFYAVATFLPKILDCIAFWNL